MQRKRLAFEEGQRRSAKRKQIRFSPYRSRFAPLETDGRGQTLLHKYCNKVTADLDGLRRLLASRPANSIDINAVDFLGKTALHYAAAGSSVEIVQELVRVFGPRLDLEIKDHSGDTPILLATDNIHWGLHREEGRQISEILHTLRENRTRKRREIIDKLKSASRH
jgi:hypothetical protein